jgi:hypothetical protein
MIGCARIIPNWCRRPLGGDAWLGAGQWLTPPIEERKGRSRRLARQEIGPRQGGPLVIVLADRSALQQCALNGPGRGASPRGQKSSMDLSRGRSSRRERAGQRHWVNRMPHGPPSVVFRCHQCRRRVRLSTSRRSKTEHPIQFQDSPRPAPSRHDERLGGRAGTRRPLADAHRQPTASDQVPRYLC